MGIFHRPLKLTRRFAAILAVLFLLASIPNVGHYIDESICASRACSGVKLQNPVLLPYSWLLPEKKCSFCGLAESCAAIFTSSYFPIIHVMNIVVSISFLAILAFMLDYGIEQAMGSRKLRERKQPRSAG